MKGRFYICENNRPHILEDAKEPLYGWCPYTYFGTEPGEWCGNRVRELTEAEIAAYKIGGEDAVSYEGGPRKSGA